MNRKEFQDWLDQFPEDTIVEVGVQSSAPDYCPYGPVDFQEFKGELYDQYDLLDFTNNEFVKVDSDHYNKRYLQLGSKW